MVRTIVVDDNLLSYLLSVSDQNICAAGLILGQSCLGKDYIIHFAKTPPFQLEEDKRAGISMETPSKIEDFNANWLADHAIQTTRMLPGGLYVLGIFIISPEDVLNPFHSKLKSLLQTVDIHLSKNKYLYGNPSSEKLVIHHSSKTKRYFGKSYDVLNNSIQSIDIKSSHKKWTTVQCDFRLNNLRYLLRDENDWPLEKHIKMIMDEIFDNLETAIYLFDGEFKDKNDNLEGLGKQKVKNTRSNRNPQESGDAPDSFLVSILQSQCSKSATGDNIINSSGNLKLVGKVACKLWLQPKLTIGEAARYVKEDILRSLTSRLEMHWDSLTEEENSEDVNSVHEPPRRVLIALPDSEISLSDYLFPGEGPQEAKVSFEELLDIKIDGELNITDVEGQAEPLELDKYYKSALNSDSVEDLPKVVDEGHKLMYTGLIISLIILVIAVLFNVL